MNRSSCTTGISYTTGILAAVSLLSASLAAGDPIPVDVPGAIIQRAAGPIVVDGRIDEPSWQAAAVIDEFGYPWWQGGYKERTEARMLWDDDALYVAFVASDHHVTAAQTERDSPVSRDDCVEVFIAPDTSDVSIYYNFEFNALGTILDRSPHDKRSSSWNADGLQVAVVVDGTLNENADTDSLWTTEIAIPFDVFEGFAPAPTDGTVWRLNLYRTGGAVNLQYMTWSNTRAERPNFHVPQRFGVVHFARQAAGDAP